MPATPLRPESGRRQAVYGQSGKGTASTPVPGLPARSTLARRGRRGATQVDRLWQGTPGHTSAAPVSRREAGMPKATRPCPKYLRATTPKQYLAQSPPDRWEVARTTRHDNGGYIAGTARQYDTVLSFCRSLVDPAQ